MPDVTLKTAFAVVAALSGIVAAQGCGSVRAAGANGLLHPARRVLDASVRETRPQVTFAGADVVLAGWKFPAQGARRGTVVYLHGIADNRGSGLSAALRLSARGFDVVAYDSRAHGDSGGEICTYGFYEKRDLQRVLDALESGPMIVMGSSLGGAVALQAAAEDARITAVIAAESFSDLRTVAAERAPWFFTAKTINEALALAEKQGSFQVDAVSPKDAARRISVPVLLIHGALDHETPPEHSRRIFDSLGGRRRLLLVEGAGHNQSLQPSSVWSEIESWIESVLGRGV
jgi:pimeloyl-ACP methyl ester carboxylesterase